jgi:cbb3-type cytochrome c oxidase subunit III
MALFSPVIRLSVILLLLGTLLIGYTVSKAVANRSQRSQVSSAKAKEAKRLFKQKCTKCHGQDGAGSNYGQIIGVTNLTDPEWHQRVDDQRIINSIKHGRGQMPAAGEKLTEEQITSLMLYVRTLKK